MSKNADPITFSLSVFIAKKLRGQHVHHLRQFYALTCLVTLFQFLPLIFLMPYVFIYFILPFCGIRKPFQILIWNKVGCVRITEQTTLTYSVKPTLNVPPLISP